ncbi:MAG: PAS domain S-box protein, partial [Burkholderiales bacterium]|nr:PAS domain S-box protein [Burkholderiales bacterium]
MDKTPREILLREQEERFRSTFEQAAVGIAHTTPESRILLANRKLCEMLGYAADELIGRSTTELTHPEDSGKQDLQRRELIAGTRDFFAGEKRYLRKDGGILWVNRTVTLARQPGSWEPYLIQVIEDVSARRKAEERLERVTRAHRVMTECNQALVHAAHEPGLLQKICDILVRSGGYCQAWIGLANDDTEKSVSVAGEAGYRPGYLRTLPRTWAADSRREGVMGRVIATGQPLISQNILAETGDAGRKARALEHGYQASISLPLTNGRQVIGGISIYAREPDAFDAEEIALLRELADDICFGITTLRARLASEQAEARSRESERRAQEIFNQAAVGMMLTALDSKIIDINQKFADMLGYTREELIGASPLMLTHPDDREEMLRHRQQLLAGEVAQAASQKRYLRKDGGVIWTNRTFSVVRNDAGEPLYLVGVVEDITGRKEAEQRFGITFNQAAVGIAQVSLDGKYLMVNRKFCEIVGYTEEELIWHDAHRITHPEDQPRILENRALLASGRRDSLVDEKRYVRKDGHIVWGRRTISLARDAAGQPLYSIRVVEDITEHKEAEERYRATFDNAPVGILHTALDRRILHVNDKACQILGYTRDEMLRLTTADILPPDYVEADRPHYLEAMLRGEMRSYSSVRPFIRKDGSIVWTGRTVSLVRDADGKPLYFIRIIEDISDRLHTERALRESEEQFRQLAGNIPQVFWIGDATLRKTIYVSAACEQMLGIPAAMLKANPRLLVRAVHPDDRARIRNARKSAALGRYDETYRVIRSDGAVRWIQDRAFPVHDSEGRVYR